MSTQPVSAPEKKRVTPVNLLVAAAIVLAIQAFALGVTSMNLPTMQSITSQTGYSYDPGGPSPAGSAVNAVLLVFLAFALTVGMVWLLKSRKVLSFKAVVFGSVAFSAFFLTWITASVFAENYVPAALQLPVSLAVPAMVVALLGYVIFVKNRQWLATALLAFVGAEVGSFFASTLPFWTALALPIAFAVYDIYAVFRGTLKSLVGTDPTIALVGMSIRAGEFTLGLGDIVFYTLLPSLAFYEFYQKVGIFPALLTIAAIEVGVIVTLYLLSRRRMLPGLPIPMLLGVLVIVGYLA